jgi:hypothetical protein
MSTQLEIMDFSREWNLAPNIVEKDYVLGWVLAGISDESRKGTVVLIRQCFGVG